MTQTISEMINQHYRDNLEHLVAIAQETLNLISQNPYYQSISEDLNGDVTLGDCRQFLNSLSAELDSLTND
ncbi:hypothetical protein NIES2100_73710 [Calothrix sp. NIES-2100]|uniref:hypothetical protein n=1 Tax=Calothrix sp. NIES-2100 TaxID=1954172 RepID=UPI000B61C895|nr:hypothetical protein NIES2100_73710 [Calothrix sp. NIES-2100]